MSENTGNLLRDTLALVAPGTVLTLDRRAIGMKVEPAAGTTEQGGQD